LPPPLFQSGKACAPPCKTTPQRKRASSKNKNKERVWHRVCILRNSTHSHSHARLAPLHSFGASVPASLHYCFLIHCAMQFVSCATSLHSPRTHKHAHLRSFPFAPFTHHCTAPLTQSQDNAQGVSGCSCAKPRASARRGYDPRQF